MKAWQVKQLADPEKALYLADVDKPAVEKGKVLIKVESSAINFYDILLCQGKYQEKPPLPFTPGSEVSGTIEEIAEGSKFKVGQRVLAQPTLPNGGYAEYVAVDENRVYEITDSMNWNEAAALFVTYQTAYYALHYRAQLKEGEVLLVHAGAGGVGSAAIQLGKAAGAKVIATAGGSEKIKVCLDLGADVVIDYLKEDFVDIVKKETTGRVK